MPDDVQQYWWPLAERVSAQSRPYVLGINGAQGSGKTTLARNLQSMLVQTLGLQVAVLSIDDLYHTRAQRRWLAEHIHPLLLTRGVPGTHDVILGLELIRRFRAGLNLQLPRFDKSGDDRALQPEWLQGPVDILIIEGWCLGAQPQPEKQLTRPLNSLEATQDPHGIWRQYVNRCLGEDYRRLFAQLDELIVLQAPDWQTVVDWRSEQEQKLIQRTGKGMDHSELAEFMLCYQRLTEHQLANPPTAFGGIYRLGKQRQILSVEENNV
ncbi:kinase [Lacimicrobium alkaliphilum]|nr:kinase [Lacimicrobium alkaliphilum]